MLEILLLRHGETDANRQGRVQGHLDWPLNETGRKQAQAAAQLLQRLNLSWDAGYVSPLQRAVETGEIVTESLGLPSLMPCADLIELGAGSLEGLTREELETQAAEFMTRPLESLGDFSLYGGESYEGVMARIERLISTLHARHLGTAQRLLLVSHGGLLFHLVKRWICLPVPRVAMLTFGNCTLTGLRIRERRGVLAGELQFHVPLELLGGPAADGISGWFR